MGSDDIFKKNRRGKLERKENLRRKKPDQILIVCEGVETEPNYLNGLKAKLEDECKKRMYIEIKGVGRCTTSLVDYTTKLVRESKLIYNEIWCVFDKDDFIDFDNAIEHSKKMGYMAAWSNESFELWLLLHFQYLDSQIGRADYNDKLSEIFNGFDNDVKKYDKSIKDIYDILHQYGDEQKAIKFAKRLEE
ncbi:MAG: RloB domain-containing protein, partial [Clostridia bacterium]|nr:RloB domain-containing protein [Clostridia bacterium]